MPGVRWLASLCIEMVNKDKEIERLERLKNAEDPNEFIELLRRWTAEDAGLPEERLFPLPDDSAGDIVEGFIGVWLVACARVPVNSEGDVVEAIDGMIGILREWQGQIQSSGAQLERDLLRCLRKATRKTLGKDYWTQA